MAIDNSVKFFADLSKLLVTGVQVVKLGKFWDLLPLLGEVKDVVVDAQGALPELKNLDAEEALQLGQAAYDCVASVVRAFA